MELETRASVHSLHSVQGEISLPIEEIVRGQLCQCKNTWVLVIHNDFLQVEGYERHGDDVDVKNLKRVFQTDRNCKFAELANCNKTQIIETLSNEEKLVQLYHPENDCKYLVKYTFSLYKLVSHEDEDKFCKPELLYLFVLSHGEAGGKILTDHFKITTTQQKNFVFALETYTTSDVWNGLSSLDLLNSCTKLLFFAVCYSI
jgi:hypothetical protein